MNPPNRPESINPKILWTLLALFLLTATGVGILAFQLAKRTGVHAIAGLPGVAATTDGITPLDLKPHYDRAGSWNTGSEWESVPRGLTVLGGVPFDLSGLLRLNGRAARRDNKPYREKVEGIEVGKKFARLHLLHIASYSYSPDRAVPYARIILNYADGTKNSLPIIYAQHARDWRRPKYEFNSALSDPNSKVVWRGTYNGTDESGKTLRIFKSTFENPRPDEEVTTIDVATEDAWPNATILAMSVGPANLPKAKDDPASLPEPAEAYDGAMQLTVVDEDSQKPLAGVMVSVNGTDASGSFRPPELITDRKGQGVVRHPGETTRSLTVVASGDGAATKTTRWQTLDGEPIPEKFTLNLGRAVTIGGTVKDETGQPVALAKISLQAMRSPGMAQARDLLPFTEASVNTDAQGHWEFRSLPPKFGEFRAGVSHSNFIESYFLSDGVDRAYVGERVKMAELLETNAVFQLRKGLVITGRVLTEAGVPIVGAKVLLANNRYENKPPQARTDDAGAFQIAGGKLGATYLTVQASGFAPQMRAVTVEAKMEPAEFKLAPGHVLKALVVDEFGTPVRTARVTVDMWENQQTIDLTGTTDSRGRVTINSAPASGMSGSVYKSGYMNMGGIQFVADGEEHTFTLRKSATFSGSVVDADTKEPIEKFDVTRGQNSGDRIYWQTYNTIKGSNGMFSLKLDQQGITALKVEADEHLPLVVSIPTNGETHFNVELKKGSGPKGFVRGLDGQPVAKAQLAVIAPGRSLNIGWGRLANGSRGEGLSAETDEKGAFTLRPQPDGEKILVLHSNGYAETSFSNFVSGSTISLQAWGVIEGELTVANQPGTNQAIMLTPGANPGASSYWYDSQQYRVVTDAAGKFVISNAPPGERRVVRLIPINANSWSHGQPTDVLVKPGEVTHMTMGGDGHLLTGQLALSDPSLKIDWRNSGHHSLNSFPKPPPFKTAEEYRAWAVLPETIEAQKKARSYTVQVSETGSFRIEEVLPGQYDLQFYLQERDAGSGRGQMIGSLVTNVVVPAFTKGTKPPPLDLGSFVVPVAENSRAMPATRAPRADARPK